MKLQLFYWIFLIVVLSTSAVFGLDEAEEPKYHGIRAERGVIKDALKGAAVGAAGNKALGGSAKTGGLVGGVAAGAMSALHKKGKHPH